MNARIGIIVFLISLLIEGIVIVKVSQAITGNPTAQELNKRESLDNT